MEKIFAEFPCGRACVFSSFDNLFDHLQSLPMHSMPTTVVIKEWGAWWEIRITWTAERGMSWEYKR